MLLYCVIIIINKIEYTFYKQYDYIIHYFGVIQLQQYLAAMNV